jgi:DNA-binding winged helix-turn-helix (wHTH) protein
MSPLQPFSLGSITVLPSRLSLDVEGELHAVEPLAMRVLLCLVEANGRVVTREEVIQSVWPDGYAGDGSLSRAVWSLRQVMKDDAKRPQFIETVPRVGYRLKAEIHVPVSDVSAKRRDRQQPAEVERLRNSVRRLKAAVAVLSLILVGVLLGWQYYPMGPTPTYQQRLKVKRADGTVDSVSVVSSSPLALTTTLFDKKP